MRGGGNMMKQAMALQANMKKLMQNGDKGFVFFHHSVASWVHTWPAGVNGSNAYVEVMGGAADWGSPLKNIRGKDYPPSGFKKQPQHITVMDKSHPVTAGVEDFDILDESYLWPVFEDSVHPLLRTNVPKLSLLPSGTPVSNSTELLASAAMELLLDELATKYADRIIVFDGPPLLATTESRVLAARVGQVVMVVESGKTTQGAVAQAFATVEHCPVVMSVLNKFHGQGASYRYGYYGY